MKNKKNILFILTDQWPHNFFQYCGLPAPTPNIDRLATQATRFKNAFTTCPLCAPARATLHTSRWSCQTGLYDNIGGGYSVQKPLNEKERTWVESAVEAGYWVGYYGKWHLGHNGPIKRGAQRHSESFDWPVTPYSPETNQHSYEDIAQKYEKESNQLKYGIPPFYGRWLKPEKEHAAFQLSAQASRFLKEHKEDENEKPFFLTASFSGPHFPHYLPDRFADLAESLEVELPQNLYDDFKAKPDHHGMPWWPSMDTSQFDEDEWRRVIAYSIAHITLVDEAIGHILEQLEACGYSDETTVIFSSDHGDTCGSHNRFDKGAYFYEEVWRIPLLIREPGTEPSEQDAFVSLIDIGQTLFEMIAPNTTPSLPTMGRDLRPLLRGTNYDTAHWPDRAYGVYQSYNGMSFAVRAIRDQRFKYVWNPQTVDEFYDLENDPHELTNSIHDTRFQVERERLRSELFQWLDSIGDELPAQASALPPAGTILATGEMGP